VDDEDALVGTVTREFDVNAPIYVGGVPRGFLPPTETMVSNGVISINKHKNDNQNDLNIITKIIKRCFTTVLV